jgi:hypothetical protein
VVELSPGSVLVVEDASAEPQFSENACIRSLGLRMIAATALVTPAGECIGTLVVMDTRARALEPRAQEALRQLARQVVRTLELRAALLEAERLRAAAAASADAAARAKDELVALISHEARAPRRVVPCGPTCRWDRCSASNVTLTQRISLFLCSIVGAHAAAGRLRRRGAAVRHAAGAGAAGAAAPAGRGRVAADARHF